MAEQLKARKDSNALGGGADQGAPDGEAAVVGFTKMSKPSQGPAESNSDIPSSKGSVGSLGQEGTSIGAYKEQPHTVDAKNPKW